MARSLSDTFAGWIHQGAETATTAVHLRVAETVDVYRGGGRYPKFDPWVALRWSAQEDGPEPGLAPLSELGGRWKPTRGPWADNPLGWFVAGYGPFRRLSLAPAEAHRTMMTRGRPAGLASLFSEQASLSEAVHWLKQVYLRNLEGDKESERLQTLILALLNDGLLPDDANVTQVTSEGLWVTTSNGPTLPMSALSDGYRSVAALVLDILKQLSEHFGEVLTTTTEGGAVTVENEGVVLIDEIDVHLHVEWQQRIGFWMKRHFPNLQFIVTTHSPFICQAADIGGLVRLPAPGEVRSAEILVGDRYNAVVNGSADEAILTDLFGLETPLSSRSVDLRREITEAEVLVATGTAGSEATERLARLRQSLPSSVTTDVARALERLVAGE